MRGGECARVVGNVRAWWGMCARAGQCARGVGNVRAGWAMCARGGVMCAWCGVMCSQGGGAGWGNVRTG